MYTNFGHSSWPCQVALAINFYNNTADATVLATLLSLDLDSTIPTLLVGDFNILFSQSSDSNTIYIYLSISETVAPLLNLLT
jgi:hypothetical protein